MAILKMMVGCPGSGKTTYVKMMANKKDLIVSRDKIRFSLIAPGIPYFSKEDEVFREFITKINKGAENHGVVWADATHITRGSRHKLYCRLDKTLFNKIEVYVINTPLERCLINNERREGRERVPESALRDMYAKFTYPTADEFEDMECSIINIEYIFN